MKAGDFVRVLELPTNGNETIVTAMRGMEGEVFRVLHVFGELVILAGYAFNKEWVEPFEWKVGDIARLRGHAYSSYPDFVVKGLFQMNSALALGNVDSAEPNGYWALACDFISPKGVVISKPMSTHPIATSPPPAPKKPLRVINKKNRETT